MQVWEYKDIHASVKWREAVGIRYIVIEAESQNNNIHGDHSPLRQFKSDGSKLRLANGPYSHLLARYTLHDDFRVF